MLQGLLIALACVGLLLGGFSLALAETNINAAPVATPTLHPTDTSLPTARPTATNTTKAGITPQNTPTPRPPTATPTLPPPPTSCPPPAGWVAYTVKSGDTLAGLAARFRTNITALKQGNCLISTELINGSIIYVPPAPTATRIPCGPPAGWVIIYVQQGDTLFRLSQAYGITVTQLQLANCMGSSTVLRLGQSLYAPPWAPLTPIPTIPLGPTDTYVPTNTFIETTPTDTPVIPTDTPVDTPTS